MGAYGSKRLPLRKNHKCSGYIEFQAGPGMLDSFFLQSCPTSAKDMWPFNKSKIFTLLLQLSTFTFILLFVCHLFFGGADFHKIKGRETLRRSHNDLKTQLTVVQDD
jgi:hypothetical protein